jgi:hypothetical protein
MLSLSGHFFICLTHLILALGTSLDIMLYFLKFFLFLIFSIIFAFTYMYIQILYTHVCIHAVDTNVQVSLFYGDIYSFGYMGKSDIARSYGTYSFLRNLHTDFHTGYTNLHSWKQYIRVYFQ